MKIKGSLTIEATILLPIVIIIMFMLIALSLMQYQKYSLQNIANKVTREDAMGFKELMDDNIYWRIYDDNKDEKITAIKGHIEDKNILLDDMGIEVQIERGLTGSYIVVNIEGNYSFGYINMGQIQVQSRSRIKDTTEMIRVMRFVDDKGEYIPGYAIMKVKWENTLNDTIEKIEAYFR